MEVNAKLIHFESGGVKCAADLYLPDAGAYVYPRPGVVIGHGFSIIKSALVQQATYLVNAGYVVMAIDYRTFGESEGEPRAQIWPLDQVEDFRNAITWLEQRTELVIPERIGIWGWHVPHGLDTPTAAKEAKLVAKIARRFGLAGILMDAEAEANFFRGTEAEASLYRLFAACIARYSWQDTRDL